MATKNRVILGCMTFGPPTVELSRVSTIKETKEIFQCFKDRGYNEIDTARVYIDRQQEAWSAEAGWKTDYNFDIATKCFPFEPGYHTEKHLTQELETSLAALKTDFVNVYYLHVPDRSVPLLETVTAIDKLYRQGKFKIFGISNYTAYEVAEMVTLCRANGFVQPTLYQARYNCITRDVEEELFPALRHYGLDIVVFNPIAGGLFSGKYNRTSEPTEGRFRGNSAQGSTYRDRYFHDAYWTALDIVQPAAEKHGLTMLEVALRWLVHHSALKLGPAVGQKGDGIIIGVSSKSQLENDLDALEKGPLPEDVIEALDKAAKIARTESNPYWYGKLEYSY
ncbi:NADP-dependent oxidoreductase domain-containing protein [Lipomyces arxii]|uniref:NADP-dependent oxidoreductase domain-containing protein n=1 Tax=Lipomyces arxii TaxID=56418 RepID=UPI0034CD747A